MKILYKPFGLLFGILGGIAARKLFELLWAKIDDEKPPKPTTEEATWGRVLGASVVQGATFSVTKAAIDRAGAKGFTHLTGVWPGERRPDPE